MNPLLQLTLLLSILAGCVPLEDPRVFTPGDLRPPVFLGFSQPGARSIILNYSETVQVREESLLLCNPQGLPVPDIQIASRGDGSSVELLLPESPGPGQRCTLSLQVQDGGGNSLDLLLPFYGFNADLPAMVINEVTTQGSTASPDMVEIAVLSDGNCAGALFCEGVYGDADQELIFPPIEVKAGEFIIIHCKAQGLPEEIDEVTNKTASGGAKAHDEAWDIWIKGGSGLSGNNGVLTLYSRPGGEGIDGFLYSNRTSSSDTTYRGFGSSKMLNRAEVLAESGLWQTGEGAVRPEDGVNPDDSTATRSIFRMPGAADRDSREDWYIGPTSSASFGAVNGTEVYLP